MSVLKNLNYIKTASYYPCYNPDPILVIEAGLKAAAPVLMEAATFSCLDFIRLRAGISPWHARGLKALINGINPPQEQNLVNGLYKFTIPVQKLLFFWFVVDLTTEFIALWQSNIFQLGACQNDPHTCTWSGQGASWVSPGSNIDAPISYAGSGDLFPCPPFGGSQFIVPNGYYFDAYFSLDPEPIHHLDAVGSCSIFLHRHLPHAFSYTPNVIPPPWFGNKVHASYKISGQNKTGQEGVYQFRASTDVAARAAGGSMAVSISQFPMLNKGIIPSNCLGAVPPLPPG